MKHIKPDETTPLKITKGMKGWFWHPELGPTPCSIKDMILTKQGLLINVSWQHKLPFQIKYSKFTPQEYSQ